MFQRRKDNKYFWFGKQIIIFFLLKDYLCLSKKKTV